MTNQFMKNAYRIEVQIPIKFADDHAERGLPTGTEVKRTKRLVTFGVNYSELREWISDAKQYSNCTRQGWSMDGAIGLQNSARATVKRLEDIRLDIPWMK